MTRREVADIYNHRERWEKRLFFLAFFLFGSVLLFYSLTFDFPSDEKAWNISWGIVFLPLVLLLIGGLLFSLPAFRCPACKKRLMRRHAMAYGHCSFCATPLFVQEVSDRPIAKDIAPSNLFESFLICLPIYLTAFAGVFFVGGLLYLLGPLNIDNAEIHFRISGVLASMILILCIPFYAMMRYFSCRLVKRLHCQECDALFEDMLKITGNCESCGIKLIPSLPPLPTKEPTVSVSQFLSIRKQLDRLTHRALLIFGFFFILSLIAGIFQPLLMLPGFLLAIGSIFIYGMREDRKLKPLYSAIPRWCPNCTTRIEWEKLSPPYRCPCCTQQLFQDEKTT